MSSGPCVHADGTLRHLGDQLLADLSELRVSPDGVRTRFEVQRAERTFKVDGLSVFALSGAEIALVQGRTKPRFAFTEAEQAILAADIVVHLAPRAVGDRRRATRQARAAVAILAGRMQWPSPNVHAVYRSGERLTCDELADGAFSFAYRRWAVELLG